MPDTPGSEKGVCVLGMFKHNFVFQFLSNLYLQLLQSRNFHLGGFPVCPMCEV